MTSESLPQSARAVIVGGGIVGCSVAYHVAGLTGWRDTVVLEQQKVSGGTTWHAAGMVGRLRVSKSMTEVNKYSAELYARLEAETGLPTGWRETGSLMVAQTAERMTQLRRTVAMAELFGVEAAMVDTKFVAEKWPLMRVDDLKGAAWIPGDGKVKPELVTKALAAGAAQRGAKFCEGVRVLRLLREGNRVVGVETDQGTILAEMVILCGGMWARQLGLECGLDIPLYPVEHHYVVSPPIDGLRDDLPIVRDPDSMTYFRPDGDTMWLGGFQKRSTPWIVDRVPDDFSFQLLHDDWPKFVEPLEAGKHRLPVLARQPFAKFINGPESFTADNNFLLGQPPRLDGVLIAAGFNSAGIACAGGAGRLIAQWLETGEAPSDLWSVDPRRFGPLGNNRELLRDRVAEALGWHYQMAWPNREPESARGVRRSTLYETLAAAGACFGQKNLWERPLWFAPRGSKPQLDYSFGRQNWFPYSAAEHRAAREQAAIFDQTTFSKYFLEGPDACRALQWLCANNVDVEPGQVVYTALLNRRGTFETDLTVIRLASDRYYIVTSTAQTVHDFDWIARNMPPESRATLTDVTGAYGVLGVMGPKSRDILRTVTDAAVDNEAFPFGTARRIDIGQTVATAVRITYVGELGWELHLPIEQMPAAYAALWEAGQPQGLVNSGHYAINSLRLEKGYCAWGADISPDETPLEAGLGFAVDFNKEFLGREALLAQKKAGVRKRRLVFVLKDPAPMLWGAEPIWQDGRKAGYTTSAAYGHTLGGAVAMGYIKLQPGQTASDLKACRFEIENDGQRYEAAAHLRSPYDPDGVRIKA
ncbi:MAG: FAD-dependent oxidoreductase [Planctomycetes bacterium]|nr:FAD-dependent oxidoreductase [Planctomycetota bacterium]